MGKVCGFALFFFALGMITTYLVKGLLEFTILVLSLFFAYILFCKC